MDGLTRQAKDSSRNSVPSCGKAPHGRSTLNRILEKLEADPKGFLLGGNQVPEYTPRGRASTHEGHPGASLTGGGRKCLARRQLSLQAIMPGAGRVRGRQTQGRRRPTISLRRAPSPGASSRRPINSLVYEPVAVHALETNRLMVRPRPDQVSYYKGIAWSDRLPRLVQARMIEISRTRARSRP